ncbi:MAG: hypothetical protein M1835_006592 [Candelina submexicana]|nr:MAG: hypothetical protein M1835_006592 [Candelina submexicana]
MEIHKFGRLVREHWSAEKLAWLLRTVRTPACENLVGYSTSEPSIFKSGRLTPIKDLKLLVKDYAQIAKNALIILVNLSDDQEVLQHLAKDDAFLESLLLRITDGKYANANEIAMLLANLAKSDSTKRILTLTRATPKPLSTSSNAMDQLMDCFVKGAQGAYNKAADYDFLAYFFADIAKFPEGQTYFNTAQAYDSVIPLTKLTVFTEHASLIRRLGVASTLKNVSFSIPSHPLLLSSSAINVLPYVLLPLTGGEEYTDEDTNAMLPDLQLLPPDKEREKDNRILTTHLETLLLLTTTREGRDALRSAGCYPVVRETHLAIDDEEVQEGCDRLVQVLMRDEEGEGKEKDEDERIVEVL